MQIIFYETSNSAFTQMDDRNTQLEKKRERMKRDFISLQHFQINDFHTISSQQITA
jgi:hypothetical protein